MRTGAHNLQTGRARRLLCLTCDAMTEWYYRDSECQKIGPLSTAEFDVHVAIGEVRPQTQVWRSGLGTWTTYAALLAHEAHCPCATSGPSAGIAPESSSYCTFIALGASAANRRPAGPAATTPAMNPPAGPPSPGGKCPGCQRASGSRGLRGVVCGDCFRDRERKRLLREKRAGSGRFGKLLVRGLLIAAAFMAARAVFSELRQALLAREGMRPAPEPIASGPLPQAFSGPGEQSPNVAD